MEPTKWGIIGPGNIAHSFVNDLPFVNTRQQVVAVLSDKKESAYEFAREFSIPRYYTNLDKFIREGDMDAVYIATPHPHHFEQAIVCLNNKIAVLCEKPMTINADQCRQLIKASQENKTFLMEGMWLRFLPSIKQLLRIIGEGAIGKITSLRASVSYKAPADPDSRYFDPEQGGGSLLDLGIYPVFLSLLLLGKPDSIKSIAQLSDEGIDEACSILLHYKNGSHAILESSIVSTLDIPAEIVGEKGVIKILNPWFEKASGVELQVNGEGKVIYPCRWEGHGLYFEIEEVINCLRNENISSELLPHSFSLEMIKILDKIRSQIHVVYDMYE
jgi:predicted dehydrogenase